MGETEVVVEIPDEIATMLDSIFERWYEQPAEEFDPSHVAEQLLTTLAHYADATGLLPAEKRGEQDEQVVEQDEEGSEQLDFEEAERKAVEEAAKVEGPLLRDTQGEVDENEPASVAPDLNTMPKENWEKIKQEIPMDALVQQADAEEDPTLRLIISVVCHGIPEDLWGTEVMERSVFKLQEKMGENNE